MRRVLCISASVALLVISTLPLASSFSPTPSSFLRTQNARESATQCTPKSFTRAYNRLPLRQNDAPKPTPIGGLSMGLFDMFSSPGLTVSKLQLSVWCEDRGQSSLLGTLTRIAETADTSSPGGVTSLVSDTALALLRKEVDWMGASLDTESVKDEDAGEQKFSQFSLQERSKIERETVNRIGGEDKSEERAKDEKADPLAKGTVAVVTLVLALENRELEPVTDIKSLKQLLLSLGSDLLDNDSLLAAEILWTPEEPTDRIAPGEVALEWPSLIPL